MAKDVVPRVGANRFRLPLRADGRRDMRPGPAAGTLSLVSTSVSVNEGFPFNLVFSRTGGSDGAVAVDWTVSGATTVPQTGTVNWAAGDAANKTVQVTAGLVIGDTAAAIALSNPRSTDGAPLPPVIGVSGGTVTIIDAPPYWTLPGTLNIVQNGTIGLRQYAFNAAGWTISVTNLPAGVTYNTELERLEGASTGTSTGTATFTLTKAGETDVVATATVALIAQAEGFTAEAGFTVTGTLVDGGEITIADTSGAERFGPKDAQAVYAFDDYEDGVIGEPVDRPWHRTEASTNRGVFANDHSYSGTKSLKADWNISSHAGHGLAFDARCIYVSMRFRLEEYPGQINNGDMPQLKMPHFNQQVGAHEGAGNGYINGGIHNAVGVVANDGETYDRLLRNSQHIVGGLGFSETGSAYYNGPVVEYPSWVRMEYFWLLSTGEDNLDGVRYIKTNGSGMFRFSSYAAGRHWAAPSSDSTIPDTEYWGQLMRTRPVGDMRNIVQGFYPFYKRSQQRLAYWLDEVYMDQGQDERAQTRIEIGPASFGTDSRQRNPCRYTAWAPGTVTITLNQGPHASLAGRALWLIGAQGQTIKVGEFTEHAVAQNWQHGEIVTLTPDQFGLATFGDDPNMRLFDTQDNQSVYDAVGDGEDVPVGPGYVWAGGTSSANRPMQFETGTALARHPFDTKRYRFDGRGFLSRPYAMSLNHTYGRKMFLECWIRYEVAQTANGSCKVFRIWGDSSGLQRYSSKTNNPSFLMGINWWNSSLRDRTDWMRITCEIDTSSSDVLEWRGRYWVDGQLVIDHFRPPEQSGSTQWPQLTWGPPVLSLIGHDPRTPESTFGDEWRWGRLTDVYLGIGPERFAITDASTFAATGAYETQEIVSWSPSAVQIRVFEGALDGLGGKYVHFVGSGNVAQGTALEIPSGYDLTAALASLPEGFAGITLPTDPNITGADLFATTTSELNSALQTNGRRIYVSPGTYGDITANGADQHIIFTGTTTLGNLAMGGQRLRFEAEVPRSVTFLTMRNWNGNATSVWFQGIRFVSGGEGESSTISWQFASEVRAGPWAFVGCYIDQVGHAMFGGNSPRPTNLLIANTYVNQHRTDSGGATQAGPRIHQPDRFVCIDSRFRNMGRQSLRVHATGAVDATNVVLLRNQFVGSGIQFRANSGVIPDPGTTIRDAWIVDNTWYHDRNVVMIIGSGTVDDPYPQDVVYTGNRIYGGSLPGAPAGQGWTASDNVNLGGYVDPPEWVWQ